MDLATILNAAAKFACRALRNLATGGVLALALVAFPAFAQFTAKMDRVELAVAAKAEIAKNRSAKEIVAAMLSAGVKLDDAITAALDAGLAIAAVRDAALAAGAPEASVATAIALAQPSLAVTPGIGSQATAGGGAASAR
jgi:hypothetical protein